MSDLLNIGASGVASYRTALGTVGDNIANANSAGYTRREVTLTPVGPSGSQGLTELGGNAAGGVRAGAVTRAGDPFRVADSRLTAADAARAETRSRWLATAETTLPDDDSGIGSTLTAVYAAGDALAADPDGSVPRQTFLGTIDSAAGAFRTSADGLTRAAGGIAAEAAGTVADLNGALQSLARTNLALARTQPGTSGAASLADQRDMALDTIAKAVGVDATLDARGVATVTVAGAGNIVLADGAGAATITLAQASDGRLSLTSTRGTETAALQPTTGALSGLADAASAVAGRRRQLDAIANDFATKLNGWSAAGTDANGRPGGALLTVGAGAAGIALLTTDTAAVAASDGTTANGNALTLAGQRGADGVEARTAVLVANLSQSVAAAKAESSAASNRADASAAQRDAASGVDLDREAADLLRFQQAYSGSAKVIQVARETLQSILSLF